MPSHAPQTSPNETPALRFAHVTKTYGDTTALAGISLNVQRGEFFGLIGVNGAGKTTLLKCLQDFCDIDDGRIEIFGLSHRVTSAFGSGRRTEQESGAP